MTKPTKPAEDHGTNDHLRGFHERIQRLESEKQAIAEDIKEVYKELKDSGYVPAVMRQIIREEKQDREKRHLHEVQLDLYRRELGLIADTPLGKAALAKIA